MTCKTHVFLGTGVLALAGFVPAYLRHLPWEIIVTATLLGPVFVGFVAFLSWICGDQWGGGE